jgi:hypothetical protein
MTYPDFSNPIILLPSLPPLYGRGAVDPISLLPISSRRPPNPTAPVPPNANQVQRFKALETTGLAALYDTLSYSACLTAAPAQPTALRASPQAQYTCNLTYNTSKICDPLNNRFQCV